MVMFQRRPQKSAREVLCKQRPGKGALTVTREVLCNQRTREILRRRHRFGAYWV